MGQHTRDNRAGWDSTLETIGQGGTQYTIGGYGGRDRAPKRRIEQGDRTLEEGFNSVQFQSRLFQFNSTTLYSSRKWYFHQMDRRGRDGNGLDGPSLERAMNAKILMSL